MKRFSIFCAALFAAATSFAAVTYELNGGVTNADGWLDKKGMYEGLNADWNAYSGSTKTWRAYSPPIDQTRKGWHAKAWQNPKAPTAPARSA